MGGTERRMLSSAKQHQRLDGRTSLEDIHLSWGNVLRSYARMQTSVPSRRKGSISNRLSNVGQLGDQFPENILEVRFPGFPSYFGVVEITDIVSSP